MHTRLVLYKNQKEVHKWVNLSTKDKQPIKGKKCRNFMYRTGPICTPRQNKTTQKKNCPE